MSNAAWEKVPATHRGVVLKTFQSHAGKLNDLIQKDNEKALEVLVGSGIKKVSVSPEEASRIRERSLQVWEAMAGHLYSKELLGDVQKVLKP